MDVPVAQHIKYNPSFLEQSIEIWIQYLALLIPSLYIIYEVILGNAFRKNVLNSKI